MMSNSYRFLRKHGHGVAQVVLPDDGLTVTIEDDDGYFYTYTCEDECSAKSVAEWFVSAHENDSGGSFTLRNGGDPFSYWIEEAE